MVDDVELKIADEELAAAQKLLKKRADNLRRQKAYRERQKQAAAAAQLKEQAEKHAEILSAHEQKIAEFGEAAVKQQEYENAIATMLGDALAYAKGEPQKDPPLFLSDDDFADLEYRLEELRVKYEHLHHQDFAIKFARESGSREWYIQHCGDGRTKAVAALEQEYYRNVPVLPPPPEHRADYYRYKWNPPRRLDSRRWFFITHRCDGNVRLNQEFAILRGFMEQKKFEILEFPQPPIVAPWANEPPPSTKELEQLFYSFLKRRPPTEVLLQEWKEKCAAEGWDNPDHATWLDWQTEMIRHPDRAFPFSVYKDHLPPQF